MDWRATKRQISLVALCEVSAEAAVHGYPAADFWVPPKRGVPPFPSLNDWQAHLKSIPPTNLLFNLPNYFKGRVAGANLGTVVCGAGLSSVAYRNQTAY